MLRELTLLGLVPQYLGLSQAVNRVYARLLFAEALDLLVIGPRERPYLWHIYRFASPREGLGFLCAGIQDYLRCCKSFDAIVNHAAIRLRAHPDLLVRGVVGLTPALPLLRRLFEDAQARGTADLDSAHVPDHRSSTVELVADLFPPDE